MQDIDNDMYNNAKDNSESTIEGNLIKKLEVLGWEYDETINTTEKIWLNLKSIIEENNKLILHNKILSDSEFSQIRSGLSFNSVEQFDNFLIGEHGVCKITIILDDSSKVQLTVFNTNSFAKSKFQVINQCVVESNTPMYNDSRFDVTLLIDGLPIVQIELKTPNISYFEAFNQIERYAKENKFKGIFSSLRLFVVSNKSGTRYFSNQASTKFNKQSLIGWKTEDGSKVENLFDFSEHFFEPETLFRIATNYFLFDSRKKSSVVLRPYQIHAVRKIEEAISENKSGYIWHTTGSGKTLTSFCATKSLTKLNNIDKTIFLVDRVDLDQQTNAEFLAYSDYDSSDLTTDNTFDLKEKLKIKGNSLIITTIQKLNKLIELDKVDILKKLKIAFVVDECHRAVSLEQKEKIDNFFGNSLWYGFTGTPAFNSEQNNIIGKRSKKGYTYTTEFQYGDVLHSYTIKDAISDNSVLGFKTDFINTFTDESKKRIFSLVTKRPTKDYDLNQDEFENLLDRADKNIVKTIYGKDHKLFVIDKIVNNSENLFDFSKPLGARFCSLLTTSSINDAMEYYELLTEYKRDVTNISEKIRDKDPDFPKFAITFSLDENKEHSVARSEFMQNVLNNYNIEFNKSYTLEDIKGYNQDVNRRLARKETIYSERSEQLDLVIVVDRLLTGFDAPMLSTLYIDREPLKSANLIQAMSRTNRKYLGKQFGNIVGFRKPKDSIVRLNNAIIIYSKGYENEILARPWSYIKKMMMETIEKFNEKYPNVNTVNNLKQLDDKKKFIDDFQELDKICKQATAYMEYDRENEKVKYGFDRNKIEDMHGSYLNIKKELSEYQENTEFFEDIDLDYQIESIFVRAIDYNYIVSLIELFISLLNDSQENSSKLIKLIEQIKNPYKNNAKMLAIFEDLIRDIKKRPIDFVDLNINHEIKRRVAKEIDNQCAKFYQTYKLDKNIVKSLTLSLDETMDIKNSPISAAYNDTKKESFKEYSKENTGVNKIDYYTILRKEIKLFTRDEIFPFKDFL